MTKKQLEKLKVGDVVAHTISGQRYHVVDTSIPGRPIAYPCVALDAAEDWRLSKPPASRKASR